MVKHGSGEGLPIAKKRLTNPGYPFLREAVRLLWWCRAANWAEAGVRPLCPPRSLTSAGVTKWNNGRQLRERSGLGLKRNEMSGGSSCLECKAEVGSSYPLLMEASRRSAIEADREAKRSRYGGTTVALRSNEGRAEPKQRGMGGCVGWGAIKADKARRNPECALCARWGVTAKPC